MLLSSKNDEEYVATLAKRSEDFRQKVARWVQVLREAEEKQWDESFQRDIIQQRIILDKVEEDTDEDIEFFEDKRIAAKMSQEEAMKLMTLLNKLHAVEQEIGEHSNILEGAIRNGIYALRKSTLEMQSVAHSKAGIIRAKVDALKQEIRSRPNLPKFVNSTMHMINKSTVLKFVEHHAYKVAFDILDHLIRIVPGTEARDLVVPGFIGVMGVGKTRTAIELCNAIGAKYNDVLVLYFRVPSNWGPRFESTADLLASVIIQAVDRNFDKPVKFSDVCEALRRDGYTKVLLHIDEVQINRSAIKKLIEECFDTMTSNPNKVSVIPVLSGISLPHQETLPSGGKVYPVQITALEPGAFLDSFAERIAVEGNVVLNSKHLHELLYFCSGSPNIVNTMANVIVREAERDQELASGLRTKLDQSYARKIFLKTLDRLINTYGPLRWHRLICSGDHPDVNSDEDALRRTSWEAKSMRILQCIFCACFLGEKVGDLSQRVGTADCNNTDYPTYQKCQEAGMFSINAVTNEMEMPLMGLMIVNQLANLLPEGVFDPFSATWRSFEVIGASSLYLRLVLAQLRGNDYISIRDLRPGAISNLLVETIEVKVPEIVRLKQLGGKVSGVFGDPINEGVDGSGDPVSMSSGLVALMKEGETGIDAICYVAGRRGGNDVKLLILTKSLEKNIGNDVESIASLHNGEINDRIVPKMLSAGCDLVKQFELGETVLIADIFSDKYDPKAPLQGLEELESVSYCITRNQQLRTTVGPAFAYLSSTKRLKLSQQQSN